MPRRIVLRLLVLSLRWAPRPFLEVPWQLRALASFAAALLLGLSAFAANAQAPIRIGASMGLTGAYAEFGQTVQRGYQLCVKQANEKGGLLGRKLELTIRDDQSQVSP